MKEKIKDSEVKKSLAEEVKEFCEKWDVIACYASKDFTTYDFKTKREPITYGWMGNPYFFIVEPENEGLLLLADFLKDHIAISNVHKWYKPSFVKEFKQLAKKVREEYDTRRNQKVHRGNETL